MIFAQDTPTTYFYTTGDATAAAAGIGIFLIIMIVIGVASLGLCIFAIIDVNKHSDAAWTASGQAKQTWFILNIVGLITCILLIPIIYLVAIRPKVAAAEAGGG